MQAPSARPSLLPAVLALLVAALLLVGESLLPGRLFLPLQPDDFPEWRAGAPADELHGHPHPDWCMSDVLHLLVPGLAVTQRAAERGELPLWDDGPSLGVPHLHQVHYAVLYPPAWLPVAFGYGGLAWMALLHLLIAGTGTLLYLVALGRSRTAALTGALAFLASAWLTARLHSFPVAGAAVWLPWVLWGLERAAQAAVPAVTPPTAHSPRGPARRYLAAATLALALSFFAGFPQVTLWIAATAGAIELVRVASSLRHRRPWARPLLLSAGALAAGALLAAPQLVPTLDYMAHDGLRGAQTPEVIAADALDAPLLWSLLVPDRYAAGALTGGHPLALADLPAARNPAAVNRAEVSFSIGTLGLLLALLAMVFGRGWRTRTFTLLAVGVLVLLFWPAALRLGAGILPLLRLGSPRRLLLLCSFALCVLAAGGLDLVRGRRLAVTVAAWSLAVLLGGAAVIARITVPSAALDSDVQTWAGRLAQTLAQPGLDADALLRLVPPENFRIAAERAASGATVAILVAAAAVLLFRPQRHGPAPGWSTRAQRTSVLLALVVGAELIFTGAPLLRAARTSQVTAEPGTLAALRPPLLLEALRACAAPGPAPLRIARLGDDPPWLRPDFAGLFGLSDLSCYVPLAPRRVSELLEAIEPGVTVSGSAIGGLRRQETLASPVLDLLGVRALLTSRADDGPLPAGWHESARVGDVRILANDAALPPAFVVGGAQVLTDPAERLARLAAPDFPPGRLVVLEEPPPFALPQVPTAAGRAVEVRSWTPGSIVLHVAPGKPVLLVVPVGWHAGWRATLDGVAAPVLRADHALLAVPLAGTQDVEVLLHFEPPYVTIALLVGGAGWLIALLVLAWPARREASQVGAA